MVGVITGVFCGIAAYFILADIYRIPYMRTSKAVNNLAKQQKEKTSSLDVWLSNIASFIAKKIHLNEFKRMQLESDLRTAQMNISPEMFMANAIVKSLINGVWLYENYQRDSTRYCGISGGRRLPPKSLSAFH